MALRLPFEPAPSSGVTLKRGVRVHHDKFGLGKVLQVEGSGGDARLVVYFDGGVGRKKMIAKYANLEVL